MKTILFIVAVLTLTLIGVVKTHDGLRSSGAVYTVK